MSTLQKTLVTITILAALAAVIFGFVADVVNLKIKDYGEGPILAMVERMRHQAVTAEWLQGPEYTITCYGQGYYWSILATSAALPGWQRTLIPGRLVSLAAALAVAALIAAVVARRVGSVPLGLFAALVFLTWPVTDFWVPYHRTDVLAVLFAFAAYVAASSDNRRGLVIAALLIAVGSLVKQTTALSAAPIFVYCLLNKRYRDALIFAVTVAGTGILLWGLVDWASGGYYLAAAIRGNLNSPSIVQGLKLNYACWSCPASLATAVVLLYLLAAHRAEAIASVYCVGFVMELAIASVTVFKEGAAVNYFLTTCALGATLLGVHGLSRLFAMSGRNTLTAAGVLGILLALGGFRDIPANYAILRDSSTAYPEIEEAIAANPPPWVLADGGWIDAVLAAGARPIVNDSLLLRFLEENGTVDSSALIGAMRRGEVKFLVLNGTIEEHAELIGEDGQKWSADIIQAMEENYLPASTCQSKDDEVFIYRHRRTND